ncbi:hypothetical protein [Dermatophilus congolensis]|uniref:hypothetical protein n=1 Tax=Dermatophilus congolensis TaxID=1863 RepID=UPI001AAFFA77|nr:hypothetical protein [Dermatophilus congolensis]MBO3143899.1 hypothetical protein [Dermatophilus congolensis]MBO3152890.1 hypothetical protein [Dermatophilus congolensis]MBO3160100.1 hypothetical protein [Dermatophilus congolensis]MBO3164175.1 hypothetical protein [Dermatophilus congolensis]MBO3177721.1 hypothetical protein [Dermatophilus congolensis]
MSSQGDASASAPEQLSSVQGSRDENSVLGGPLGRYARLPVVEVKKGRWSGRLVPAWQPVAAVLSFVAAVMVALGVLQKAHCFTHGWAGSSVFWRACYSDLPTMFVTSGLSSAAFPYEGELSLSEPLGTGMLLWLLSFFAVSSGRSVDFVAAWSVVASILAMGLVVVTVLTARRDPWRVWMVAFSPLLITVVLVGPELIGVFLVSVALFFWSRERVVLSGAVFALAICSRSYALIVLAAVVFSAVRAGAYAAARRLSFVAVVGAAAVLGVFAVCGFKVFGPYEWWLGAEAEFGSLQYLFTLLHVPLSPVVASVVAITGWVCALTVGAFIMLSLPRRPMIAEVAAVMMVVVALFSKALSPQWALLLLPLVALARLPWKVFAAWSLSECVYFVMVWMHLPLQTEPSRALPEGWYALFLVVRVAVLLLVGWSCFSRAITRRSVRQAPANDALVREPDDVAGVAAGRSDRLVITF